MRRSGSDDHGATVGPERIHHLATTWLLLHLWRDLLGDCHGWFLDVCPLPLQLFAPGKILRAVLHPNRFGRLVSPHWNVPARLYHRWEIPLSVGHGRRCVRRRDSTTVWQGAALYSLR